MRILLRLYQGEEETNRSPTHLRSGETGRQQQKRRSAPRLPVNCSQSCHHRHQYSQWTAYSLVYHRHQCSQWTVHSLVYHRHQYSQWTVHGLVVTIISTSSELSVLFITVISTPSELFTVLSSQSSVLPVNCSQSCYHCPFTVIATDTRPRSLVQPPARITTALPACPGATRHGLHPVEVCVGQ